MLTALVALLMVGYVGVTDRLIPLFAIGAFTVSQAGMERHWWRSGRVGLPLAVNAVGAVATGLTLIVILVSKFSEGVRTTLIFIPAFLDAFIFSKRHHSSIAREVAADEPLDVLPRSAPTVIVPIRSWLAVSHKAPRFAMKPGPDVRSVHIGSEGTGRELEMRWERLVTAPARTSGSVPPCLVLIESRYRRLQEPLGRYLRSVEAERPQAQVAVIIPELVESRWSQ